MGILPRPFDKLRMTWVNARTNTQVMASVDFPSIHT
jgi:hypothetical protein